MKRAIFELTKIFNDATGAKWLDKSKNCKASCWVSRSYADAAVEQMSTVGGTICGPSNIEILPDDFESLSQKLEHADLTTWLVFTAVKCRSSKCRKIRSESLRNSLIILIKSKPRICT